MNYNRTIIGGNITKDIEIRQTATGKSIGKFTVAINETQSNGEKCTSYIDCTAFGKSAENIAKFFNKGSQILIEGRLRQESWQDKKTNEKRSKVGVIVEHWEFAGKTTSDKPKAPAEAQVNTPADIDDDLPF